jgi:hypothetical protein
MRRGWRTNPIQLGQAVIHHVLAKSTGPNQNHIGCIRIIDKLMPDLRHETPVVFEVRLPHGTTVQTLDEDFHA